jgi:2'-5' RNA ligase
MRLFVALDIDEAIQQRLDDYVRTLQPRLPGVRFVRSSTYHITLKFLGEVAGADAVRERLRDIRVEGFSIRVGGVGFFPNAQAPRVFWAGIHAPELPRLAREVDHSMEALGFPAEREFNPHLTLARNGSGRPRAHSVERRPERTAERQPERPPGAFAQLPAIVASKPAPDFGTMAAREFFLYESKLSSSGPNYSKLEAFKLAY